MTHTTGEREQVKGLPSLWCVFLSFLVLAALSLLVQKTRFYDIRGTAILIFKGCLFGGMATGFTLSKYARTALQRAVTFGVALLLILIFLVTLCVLTLFARELETHFNPEATLSREHLNVLSEALWAYSNDYGGYFPYDEQGPLHSLALLYPVYVGDPDGFESPVYTNSLLRRNDDTRPHFPAGTVLAGRRCDYSYNWDHTKLDCYFEVMASSPRTFMENGHPRGHCVLYSDLAVRWHRDPFSEINPKDNIYAPDPEWPVDSDTWLRTEPLRRPKPKADEAGAKEEGHGPGE